MLYCTILGLVGIICHTGATVAETPQSQNVSAGQEVEFTCATEDNNSASTIAWAFSTNFGVVRFSNDSSTSEGGTHSIIRFTASAAHNQSTVRCIVVSGGTASESYIALLLVQGNCLI